MRAQSLVRAALRLAPIPAVLWANGCLAKLEQNVDYLLAPDALENTLFLPFSSVAPLAQFLLRFVV